MSPTENEGFKSNSLDPLSVMKLQHLNDFNVILDPLRVFRLKK